MKTSTKLKSYFTLVVVQKIKKKKNNSTNSVKVKMKDDVFMKALQD